MTEREDAAREDAVDKLSEFMGPRQVIPALLDVIRAVVENDTAWKIALVMRVYYEDSDSLEDSEE